MILEIDGWTLDVDISATMEYSAAEAADHCDCAYCRNFYEATDEAYPRLHPFLRSLGVDLEGPQELFPYDGNHYEAVYLVCGRIERTGEQALDIGNAHVLFAPLEEVSFPGSVPEGEWFALQVMNIDLPWVLEEPEEDVVSPANEPDFLTRMVQRLLKRKK